MRAIVFAALLVAACGPGSRHDGSGDDGSGSGSGSDCPTCSTLTGKVYAPKWAPGDVPPGQEIPIFGATIYVTDTPPQPLPQQVYCEPCVDTPQGAVQSRHDGSFELPVDGVGHYYLVIQKGPFRLEQQIDVTEGVTTLPPSSTTLPDRLDPANGAWIPKIAIARGNFDAVEDILGKIGFGTMSGNKLSSGGSEIQFYQWDGTGNSSVEYLVSNLSELRKYHIIFFPCSTLVQSEATQYSENWLTEANLKNIRQWVAEGGKLYVTDWSGEVGDRAFPHQITLGSGGFGTTDSEGSYNPTTLDGTLSQLGDADGDIYTAEDGKAVDPDLNQWLGLQTGPTEDNPVPSLYNPNHFAVTDNWNYITALNSIMKGVDENNMPVYDDPKAWITGSYEGTNGPLAVTYEPAGCGKVLYSTFQTAGSSAAEEHMGLMPQERVLLFLIMEISSCTQNPIIL